MRHVTARYIEPWLMKLLTAVFLIAFFWSIGFTHSAHARIVCQQIEGDEDYAAHQIVIDDGVGIWSYQAFDGTLSVLEFQCSIRRHFRSDLSVSHVSIVCARIYEHSDGFTTTHLVIPSLSSFTSMQHSGLVENSEFPSHPSSPHSASFYQYTVSCDGY